MSDFDCQVCGQHLEGVEFHPHLFCILKKAGIDNQAEYLAISGFRLSTELEQMIHNWGWPVPAGLVQEEKEEGSSLMNVPPAPLEVK